ncbi:MAG: rRNA maturation RNase YbeY [Clostridia bacterium]
MENIINLYYENETNTILDEKILENIKKVIEKTVQTKYQNRRFEISLTIVDDSEIQRLNAEYRGKNCATDVLSFPMDEFDNPQQTEPLGDIVISIERATAQATEYGHTLMREMCFLTAHSTLHLLGYDHENNENERIEMENKQDEILNSLGITREEI